jgi:DUF1009 family protein
MDTLGIIAGSRALPLLVAREARRAGIRRIVAIAFEGETMPEIQPLVDELVWLKVGQLGRLISALQDKGVTQCVMAGQITPRSLFDVRPDLRALGLLLKLKVKNAETIFGAIATELEKEGIRLIEATPWLQPAMPGPGFELGPAISDTEREDVAFGFRMAKEVARLEIGQLVVVKSGVVLAVEGFEGTDPCLTRGGQLAGKEGGAVAVKVAKENHDMRWDIPCVGARTIETCAAARIRVLAVEARKTLLLDEEAVKELLKKHRITLVTVD